MSFSNSQYAVVAESRSEYCCKLPVVEYESIYSRTNGHAAAQYFVVVLEVPEEASAEW